MHFKQFIIAALLFLPIFLPAQTGVLDGYWEGTITQDDNGKRTDFKIELNLQQKGNKITGRSTVYHEDIFSIMLLEGQISGKTFLKYHETEIIDSRIKPNLEWCLKKLELILKRDGNSWKLEGLWEGYTSFGDCVPGRVFLKKGISRA